MLRAWCFSDSKEKTLVWWWVVYIVIVNHQYAQSDRLLAGSAAALSQKVRLKLQFQLSFDHEAQAREAWYAARSRVDCGHTHPSVVIESNAQFSSSVLIVSPCVWRDDASPWQ